MLVLPALFVSSLTWGHDDGHGPKMNSAQAKFGGKLVSVMNGESESSYKAELTINQDDMIRVYVYNKEMNILKPKGFKGADAFMVYGGSEKSFKLKKAAMSFKSKLPNRPENDFTVNVQIQKSNKKLMASFKNVN